MNLKPLVIIAFGRSGSGKGTQLKLLSNKIEEINSVRPLNFATGDFFRELFEKDTFTAECATSITNSGNLQPLFLTVSMWGSAFIENIKQDSVLLIDGFPRRLDEAKILYEALNFYRRDNVIILDFIVSRETSKKRMLGRGRADDTEANTEIRLNWYDTDVVEGLEYLKNTANYVYIPIDGEKTIDDIHQDVMSKIESYF